MEFVGELLTESGVYRLASFFPHLSWSVIALLLGHLLTLNSSFAILILVLATLKVDAEHAGPVLNNLLLVPAGLMLKINTLEVILSGHIQIIHSITDPISNSGTSLYSVGLIHHLVLDVLHQLADQLSHIEALPVLRLVDDRGAVLLVDVLALFDLLSVAGLLDVWQAFVLVYSALYWVTIILVLDLIHFILRVVVRIYRMLVVASRTKK